MVSVSVFGACQSSKDWAALPLYDLPSGWTLRLLFGSDLCLSTAMTLGIPKMAGEFHCATCGEFVWPHWLHLENWGETPVNFLDDGRALGSPGGNNLTLTGSSFAAGRQATVMPHMVADLHIDDADAKADLASINVTVGDAPCEVRSPRTHQIITDVPGSLDMTWSLGVTNLGQSADTIPW